MSLRIRLHAGDSEAFGLVFDDPVRPGTRGRQSPQGRIRTGEATDQAERSPAGDHHRPVLRHSAESR
ncbi:hypothetical protein SBRY_40925 [Actinacidiphila bryophytorum]|uniref:Uncharacterized protein n=1 Tax=Actinacidiphila bryophytorum TaxID=1436133 RepID=A0A9W4MIW1_9ACTN|nr:hypothetical protein SBRY_40925 [Actinacidiphila bryophytorum]